jgi:hypothetical protein
VTSARVSCLRQVRRWTFYGVGFAPLALAPKSPAGDFYGVGGSDGYGGVTIIGVTPVLPSTTATVRSPSGDLGDVFAPIQSRNQTYSTSSQVPIISIMVSIQAARSIDLQGSQSRHSLADNAVPLNATFPPALRS